MFAAGKFGLEYVLARVEDAPGWKEFIRKR